MAAIRSLFWFLIFLAATFAFTVIFEHGFTDLKANSKQEFELLKGYVTSSKAKPGEEKKTP